MSNPPTILPFTRGPFLRKQESYNRVPPTAASILAALPRLLIEIPASAGMVCLETGNYRQIAKKGDSRRPFYPVAAESGNFAVG